MPDLVLASLIPTYLESIGIMYYHIAIRLFSSFIRSESSGSRQNIFHKKIRNYAVPVNLLFKIHRLDYEVYLP
jgi:hypothetical protein